MADILLYAIIRGVRVVPELAGPAHARSLGLAPEFSDILACANTEADEWFKYCRSPPCGQLDPTSNLTFTVLASLIKDMGTFFPDSLIHMGSDDVTMECYNAKSSISNSNMNLT